MRRRQLLCLIALAPGLALAQAPREVHGSGDTFAEPGVALAWGILRGATESATTVVVRIATDRARYPGIAVVAIDPFTKAERTILPMSPNAGFTDVRIPRSQFADFPRTEFKFFRAITDVPVLMVFYHGVPDTTPEFADAAKLEAHLASRIAQPRGRTP